MLFRSVLTGLTLPDYIGFNGKNVEECCRATGMETWDFIRKVLIDEKLRTDIIGFAMNEDNVKMFLSHPLGMPCSDGSVYSPVGPLSEGMPHPRCYGSFPRFIGKYCRDEKIMDMQTAIYKCTGLPASRLRLKNRGLLVPSYAADILVFDQNKISDTATFAQPHQFATGIEHIFVNGIWSLKDGKTTNKFGGTIV